MKTYYAHPISLYNTPQEQRDLETLAALGFEVLNPNAPKHEEGYLCEGMDYFRALVKNCDALVFRAFADGSIPAGIKKEIDMALEFELPVFELPSAISRRSLSVNATREALEECGYR